MSGVHAAKRRFVDSHFANRLYTFSNSNIVTNIVKRA